MKLVRESITDVLRPKDKKETFKEVVSYIDNQIETRRIFKYNPDGWVNSGKGRVLQAEFNKNFPKKVDAGPEFYYFQAKGYANSEKMSDILINAYNLKSFSINPLFGETINAKYTREKVVIPGPYKPRTESSYVYVSEYKLVIEYFKNNTGKYEADIVYFDYDFLKEYLGKVNESMGDILKPKSAKEIQDVMKNMSRDEWGEIVINQIDKIIMDAGLEAYVEFSGGDQAYADGVTPPVFAQQAVEDYYKNNWQPDGVMTLSNTGGIELKVIPSADGVEYRFTGETIPRTAPIEYGSKEIDDEYEDEDYDEDDDDDDIFTYFEDDNGNKWDLNQFMRV